MRGDLLLHRREEFSRVRATPPAFSTRAVPAATSHSCFGVKVNVASAKPAATRASLYATEPVARIVNGAFSNCFHSPRLISLLLANTQAPFKLTRRLA